MATKRSAPDDNATQHAKIWKRHKPNNDYAHRPNHGKKSFKKAHPVNELKSSIRSLRRLLEKQENLPADVRVEKERALQTAMRELEEAEKAKKRSDVIGKWHKIRFFERQKCERRLKKARKALREHDEGEGEGEKGDLAKREEEAEVDLNYALYFPLERDYVKLFPGKVKKGGEEGEGEMPEGEVESQGDLEMKELVRKCMKEGRLRDLREGKLKSTAELEDEEGQKAAQRKREVRPEKFVKSKGKDKRTAISRAAQREQDKMETENTDDESGDGGGFFE